ncbi:aminoacyl-histidine dipeptidase [Owenweeksia hongkongensis]|uniref:aminoacyl-histidine dipeptidase n=1 Tax=Owenweeksia hongkongensis TaxID=253245 RepID=UPI003A94F8D2
MSTEVRQLEPKSVWNHFEDLNAVPRASKKEERVIAFMEGFARSLDLPFEKDEIGNLVMKKVATAGMENRKPIIMQAHVDMVHQKNANTDFDFDTQGIQSYIDGDWVKAKGTTLGADNGMGVAAIMAVLSSTDIAHPAIEALFTVDEEAGMTGAMHLKHNWLKGEILLNLDTEEDDELSIGCAGGVDSNIDWTYTEEPLTGDYAAYKVSVSGLSGGHSGMDIIKGLGNANKILNRMLLGTQEAFGLRIQSFDGGGLRNAIPREASAIVAVKHEKVESVQHFWDNLIVDLTKEFATTDPKAKIEYASSEVRSGNFMNVDDQKKFLYALQSCQDGIRRMSPDVEDLVETSNNLARVLLQDGKMEVKCLTRSDRESAKWDLAYAVAAPFKLIGANVEHSGSYPGWKLDPNARMLGMMKDLYAELFGEQPDVLACHAGLECGLLGQHYPNLEMISFGPTIRGAHSPDERVCISSVQKFWGYLQEALKRIPAKS